MSDHNTTASASVNSSWVPVGYSRLPSGMLYSQGNLLGGWDDKVHYVATKKLAIDLGFTEHDAEIIAKADASVDTDPDTNPITNFTSSAQLCHFNLNHCPGGAANDSRLLLAVKHLELACKKSNKKHRLKHLGKAMHSIQDVFAHTDAFIMKYIYKMLAQETTFYGHVFLSDGSTEWNGINTSSTATFQADAPMFIDNLAVGDAAKFSFTSLIKSDQNYSEQFSTAVSQRFSDAITASSIFLELYRRVTLYPDDMKASVLDINKRIKESLTQPVISTGSMAQLAIDFSTRGTHGILGLLDAVMLNSVLVAKPAVKTFVGEIKENFEPNLFYDGNGQIKGLGIVLPCNKNPIVVTGLMTVALTGSMVVGNIGVLIEEVVTSKKERKEEKEEAKYALNQKKIERDDDNGDPAVKIVKEEGKRDRKVEVVSVEAPPQPLILSAKVGKQKKSNNFATSPAGIGLEKTPIVNPKPNQNITVEVAKKEQPKEKEKGCACIIM